VLENAAILVVTLAGLVAFLSPALRNWPLWRAMVTPLASIIGSGFLVLGPVLNNAYGRLAPLVMAGLCLVAWGFGGAVRANIASLAAHGMVGRRVALERLADLMLAFAYVISVAYYLNLFGAFALGLLPLPPGPWARLVTSAVYLVILIVGWTKGFRALERMELFSVSLKLAIILGLILGLGWDAAQRGINGEFASGAGAMQGWPALTLAFGLIVTVQALKPRAILALIIPPGCVSAPCVWPRSFRVAFTWHMSGFWCCVSPLPVLRPVKPRSLA